MKSSVDLESRSREGAYHLKIVWGVTRGLHEGLSVRYVTHSASLEDKLDGPHEIEKAARRLQDTSQNKYINSKENGIYKGWNEKET